MRKVVVANRGEIAARILRTAQDMGLATVAVFSDADRDAPYLRLADEAVHLGPAASAASYLNIDAILDAAEATGADMLHPGYGFLAESFQFASRVIDAGITFVGPSPDVIRKMALKENARQYALAVDIAVVPGGVPKDQSEAAFLAYGEALGPPLMVKASAGGGGKGMEVVRSLDALPAALATARRLAAAAFDVDTLILERYIEKPRHIEVQILADQHGNVRHLFERECSIQRRHQKLIEEAPAPALSASTRKTVIDGAVRLAESIGYVGAGTVEFIVDAEGNAYFLEMNTRLQVEHPVTEAITGIDIVREQFRIASGREISFAQKELSVRGHAIEARVCAEDPEHGMLPTTGTVEVFEPSDVVRVDSGIAAGTEVGIDYDSLLAKVIAHGEDREEARQRLSAGLRQTKILGLVSNQDFLRAIVQDPDFASAQVDTGFLETHAVEAERPDLKNLAFACALFAHLGRRRSLNHVPAGFRNNRFEDQKYCFDVGAACVEVEYRQERDGVFVVSTGEQSYRVEGARRVGHRMQLEIGGLRRVYTIAQRGSEFFVHDVDGGAILNERTRFPVKNAVQEQNACLAPMPGKVIAIRVDPEQSVDAGTPLVVLEAMKMEHTISAARDGRIEAILVAVGDQVSRDAPLVRIGEPQS